MKPFCVIRDTGEKNDEEAKRNTARTKVCTRSIVFVKMSIGMQQSL